VRDASGAARSLKREEITTNRVEKALQIAAFSSFFLMVSQLLIILHVTP